MSENGTQPTVWHWLYQVGARTPEEAKTAEEIAEATGLDRSATSNACSNIRKKGIADKTSDFPPRWWAMGDEFPESRMGGYRRQAKPKTTKAMNILQRFEIHLTGLQECYFEMKDKGLLANPDDMAELQELRERNTALEEETRMMAERILRKKRR
mgnify:CR=1 FL=1